MTPAALAIFGFRPLEYPGSGFVLAAPMPVVFTLDMERMTVPDDGLAPAATVLEQAFSDYLVKLPATAATLLSMVRQDSVDPAASRVWRCEGWHGANAPDARTPPVC